MELPTGKIGGLDEVPGLGVVALALVTTGKFVLIGGETCLLLMLADVSEADEADVAVTEAVANAVIDAESWLTRLSPPVKLFLLGLPGQCRSIIGSDIGMAWLAEAEEAVEEGGDTRVASRARHI